MSYLFNHFIWRSKIKMLSFRYGYGAKKLHDGYGVTTNLNVYYEFKYEVE